MENPIEKLNELQPDFDLDDIIDLSDESYSAVSSIVKDVSSEGTSARAGLQTSRTLLKFLCK